MGRPDRMSAPGPRILRRATDCRPGGTWRRTGVLRCVGSQFALEQYASGAEIRVCPETNGEPEPLLKHALAEERLDTLIVPITKRELL